MSTHVVTFWHIHVTSLTMTVSAVGFLTEMMPHFVGVKRSQRCDNILRVKILLLW